MSILSYNITNPGLHVAGILTGPEQQFVTDLVLASASALEDDVLTWKSGAPSWEPAAAGFTNPMTTIGDIIVGGTAGAAQRLAAGTEGYVLKIVSGVPAWSTAGGGGSMTSFTLAGDSGSSQTISDGDTVTIAGGTGIDTVVGATDTVTINLDSGSIASLALADSAVQNLTDLSITASASELNILDGATLDVTELNYVDGVTSSIQTQLNTKQKAIYTGTTTTAAATAAKVVTLDSPYGSYTMVAGDLLWLTYSGVAQSASSVTLNVNSAGAANVRLANANANSTGHVTASGGKLLYLYDGTYFHLIGSQQSVNSNTTYIESTTGTAVTGSSQSCAVNNLYYANNATAVAFTLPGTAAINSVVEIVGLHATGTFTVTAPAGDNIIINGNDSGAAGVLTGTVRSTVKLRCIVASATWEVVHYTGTLSLNTGYKTVPADLVGLGVLNNDATGKTTPIDADSFPITDSAASNVIKKVTFTNLKAFLKTYFDTLYSSGGGLSWSEVTGTSQAGAVNTGYILNNAGLVTLTLPTTAALGSVIRVAGKGAGGWKIAQNASEVIHFGDTNTTTGTGGSLESTNRYDSVELLCTVADTEWTVISSVGNITVV